MYALVDCNNFFVSCERVFRPSLNNRPVIVLSSNDGCAVARSNEAKALGIKMGEPLFKMKKLVKEHHVECISGNLSFYGEMSQRVMSVLREMVPSIEVYSIDEAFLDLSGIPHDQLKPLCQRIRKRVEQWTGIPVSIGIAPTKTLAKAASNVAKKYPKAQGVYDISTLTAQRAILQRMDVGDVWGIGRASREKFYNLGMTSAWHLRSYDVNHIRALSNINIQKTVLELQGVRCYDIGEEPTHRKQIISSRSFGTPVSELKDLKQAIGVFTAIAAEKLRSEKTQALQITVYARTSPFKDKPYANSALITLDKATSHTGQLTRAAMCGVEEIYRKGYAFKKAGICLGQISTEADNQMDLFNVQDNIRGDKLMAVFDSINKLMGKSTLRYAISNPKGKWSSLSQLKSPAYTSSWDELLVVG
jgi:DNA polymerase V